MTVELERRIVAELAKQLGRRLSPFEKNHLEQAGYLADAVGMSSTAAAVELLLPLFRTSDDAARDVREPGSLVDARYRACERLLELELNGDRDVTSWRDRYLPSLLEGDRVLAWVEERFEQEGGDAGLKEQLKLSREEQEGVYRSLEGILPPSVDHALHLHFKPRSWSKWTNLPLPRPQEGGLLTVLESGALGSLSELASKLAEKMLLAPGSVTTQILTGSGVRLAGIMVSGRFGHVPYSAAAVGTITLKVDASLPPELVADSFRRARDAHYRVGRAPTIRQCGLVEHTAGCVEYGFESASDRLVRGGPGRRSQSNFRFVVLPLEPSTITSIVSSWNADPNLAKLGPLSPPHAARDLAAAYRAVLSPLTYSR